MSAMDSRPTNDADRAEVAATDAVAASTPASAPTSDPNSSAATVDARSELPAWKVPLPWTILVGTFAAGLALDLWSKRWAFETIAGYPVELERERILNDASFLVPHHARVVALPADLLDFRLVLNHGAVFGIGQQRRELFIVFTVLATAAALALFAFGTRARNRVTHFAIGLILAGGIGNLYDRIGFGAVRDFLHMLPNWELPYGWRWPGNSNGDVFPWVFNVADVLLLGGMTLFILASFAEDRRAKRLQAAAK